MLMEYGMKDLDQLADEIVQRTENSMRSSIAAVEDGIYTSSCVIEQRVGEEDIHINAAITVDGSDITVDLRNYSPQVDWGGNVVFNFTYAYVFMAIKSMFDPDIPNNDGCIAPVHLRVPSNTVVNCDFPAAVAARMQVGHFLTELVYRAMSTALPERVLAGSGGTPATMNVFYGRWPDGRPWHTVLIRGGGMGASSQRDGAFTYIFPANGANTPVEILESETPLMVLKREIIPDSGGPGRQRGGLGRRVVFSLPRDTTSPDEGLPSHPVSLGIQSGRFIYPPEGLFGGLSASLSRFTVNGRTGDPYSLTHLMPGDVVEMDAAGGGGFGNPFERNPEAVLADVREGYVSIDRAKSDYGVVVTRVQHGLFLNHDATQKERSLHGSTFCADQEPRQ